MATPEPYPYRKLNYPINNLEQSFTQEQKLQTRSNIGIPSSVDNEDKVLMVDNAAGELVWADAPNGLPDIASGDEGKFLSVENGEPAWTDVDIPEQVNADWDATSGVQEILNKPNLATVATTGQYADLSGKPDIPASTSELVNDSGFITLADVPTPPAQINADWDATSGVQEILNKPTSKRVYAGNNITITEDSDGFTISSQAGQQVNADWDATSGVAEILHKPTIPTATSDLTNDSGFITLSDVPAQVNADWDSNSGASEILNKPDLSIYAETANLATVATTGSYDDLSDKPTIPQAQVNSDWNASSGVAEILNKPNLSTVATTGDYNDLSNKPSIPAAQVNADWTASSGVAEILNKPTLAAVATSGDYSDLSNTPSIPTATSDLTNDSGFITLSDLPPEEVAVMTYGTSTIEEYRAAVQSGKKLIVCRVSDPDDGWCYVMQSVSSPFPQWTYCIGVRVYQLCLDYNGITGWTTRVSNTTTSADAGKVFSVDQYGRQVWAAAQGTTYSAGTGIDIDQNNAISVENPLPASTSAEAGKYLKVDANGDPTWATGGGGGGGVNADWDETDPLEPSYIENKPTPKTLTAGANISISEGVGTLTISAAAGLPAATSADEGKCLVVDSNGDPEWGTGGKTYTGTDGVVVDNVNDTVGLEAPVDLVGGPGITVDNPDGNTVRVSLASTPYNETVLWEADLTVAVQDRAAGTTFPLSETPANFEILKVYCAKKWPVTAANDCGAFCNEVSTAMLSKQNGGVMMLQGFMAANDVVYQLYTKLTGCLTTTITEASGLQTSNGQGSLSSSLIYLHPYRIVGINRISGGN